MASAKRRRLHKYLGAPWPRGGANKKDTKMERTKQSKAVASDSGSYFVLPLVINPNGRWVYKHGKLRWQLKKASG